MRNIKNVNSHYNVWYRFEVTAVRIEFLSFICCGCVSFALSGPFEFDQYREKKFRSRLDQRHLRLKFRTLNKALRYRDRLTPTTDDFDVKSSRISSIHTC